jgi:hypothetical protein
MHFVDEDFKLFMREMLLRFDKLVNELARGFTEMNDRMESHFDDLHAENRAQREALFRILDRLDNGGAPA